MKTMLFLLFLTAASASNDTLPKAAKQNNFRSVNDGEPVLSALIMGGIVLVVAFAVRRKHVA